MKTVPTWKIASTIQEGEHEYSDSFTLKLAATELNRTTALAAVADRWDRLIGFAPAERQRFLQELDAAGSAFLPDDSRCITDLGWEQVFPIVVTVRGGVVQDVSGVPEGTVVEVQDWDGAELDAHGEPQPAVSVWD